MPTYDIDDPRYGGYFDILAAQVLGHRIAIDISDPAAWRRSGLLRSDVHTMFDRGYLGVDPAYRLQVSPRLRQEFGNGEKFYARQGEVIALPTRFERRPNSEFLEWHMDEVFEAS